VDVRHGGSEPVLVAHLIVHNGITNVFDQTTQPIRIPDVVEKALNLPLICQWLEFMENVFHFPDEPCLSGLALDLGERELTVPTSLSFLVPRYRPQKQMCRVRHKGP
jgi:hypothetical protein